MSPHGRTIVTVKARCVMAQPLAVQAQNPHAVTNPLRTCDTPGSSPSVLDERGLNDHMMTQTTYFSDTNMEAIFVYERNHRQPDIQHMRCF